MNEADRTWATILAWSVATVALLAAIFLFLLRKTRNLPPGQRVRAMAQLVRQAVWAALPPRWWMASMAAGVSAFVGVFLVGLLASILIVSLIPREVPNPTEAYEGFGDFAKKLIYTGIGISLSLVTAAWTGLGVGLSVAWRMRSSTVLPEGGQMEPPSA